MATYQYSARTTAGEVVSGVIQADSEAAVVRSLDERRLFPVRVDEQRVTRRQRRVRLREVGVMYGQLADLLRAGVPMLRALETIARAGVNERMAKSLLRLRDGVSAGKALADAMAEQPEVYADLHAAMVRAGERAGFLEDVLSNLSTFLERVDELRGRIRGAMIYPLMLIGLSVTVISALLIWFVPRFKPIFEGRALPLPTRVMFGLSDVLVEQWPLVVGVGGVAAAGIWMLLQSLWGQRLWERWRLKIPLLGKVVRTISITRFCRILGTMLANGVPILQSLAISKDATGSVILADHIERAAESVRAGETLSEPLRVCGLFPAEILEMVAVAEESNQLDRVLVEIADTVERRTDRAVDQAVRLIEPLILVLMAVTIGLVALGLLYPILTMAQSIR
jgi:general secretion pathway protein F